MKNLILFFLLIISPNSISSGVIAVSVPKAGTFILAKILEALGYSLRPLRGNNPFEWNSHDLKRLKVHEYTQFHAIASQEHIDATKEHKVLFIYRDPRGQLLSLANYIKHRHFNLWEIANLAFEDLISTLIDSYSVLYYTKRTSNWNHPLVKSLGNVKEFYSLFWEWTCQENVYVTSFEKLVGTKGGGDDRVQLEEIKNICRFLSADIDEETIENIAEGLFGGTSTFYQGKIDAWKSDFSYNQKSKLKEIAGDLLIDLGYETNKDWC